MDSMRADENSREITEKHIPWQLLNKNSLKKTYYTNEDGHFIS